ncbi:MAG: ferrous iron transport protein B [Nanoarchaeota archaeon]
MKKIIVALAGNPNCGKTSLFNNLTGLRQHVGNWPGKTVEKKEGVFRYSDKSINLIDLPGTYSLNAYSEEEVVARDYLIYDEPDVVVNVIDVTNLERNLYLTMQLIELGTNVVIVLNMNRQASKKGLKIDAEMISKLIGVPVVKIEAIDETGKKEMLDTIIKMYNKKTRAYKRLSYGKEIDEHLEQMTHLIRDIDIKKISPKWLALKILENDKQVMEKILEIDKGKDIMHKAAEIQKHLYDVYAQDVEVSVAEARYGFINGLISDVVEKPAEEKITKTDVIDNVIMHKIWGLPIFFVIILLMFQFTFSLGRPIAEFLDHFLGIVLGQIRSMIPVGWVNSLISDGVLGGVGSVLVFLPNIMLLFLFISLLEDSGYMARAAFIMDKFMHKIGLHGKSFIPMVIGFGCNVPAIMATRTLENKRDRLLTILINPFMSCSARLPVYVLFVSAFFPSYQGLVIFSFYLIGILIAIMSGFLFKSTILKGPSPAFVMELPPYRIPSLKGTIIHMWEKGKAFVVKAGTIIVTMSVVIWVLGSLPFGVDYGSEYSIIGVIGKSLAPLLKPMGFGFWEAAVALIFGFVAKEVVVSTFGTLYGVGKAGLGVVLYQIFTPLSAYAFLVFVLLYVPCMAVVAAIRRETNSWKWPMFVVFYTTAIAWLVSFIVFQTGKLLGFS